ncbi:hypothetical protein [Paraburkholderia sp. A3RO-2L]|uniref:hypothetical protein n=1 Tax=unclassified Paraburkholderia TaxID=2615204 RepID=UPI00330210F3|nr:hypothetical protein [Burkholderia vietnamiensis]
MDGLLHLVALVVIIALAIWAFCRGSLAMSGKPRLAIPSRFIGSYEIPNPYVDVLLTHAGITAIPTVALAVTHHWIGAVVALAIGIALFHIRNLVVYLENAANMHW